MQTHAEQQPAVHSPDIVAAIPFAGEDAAALRLTLRSIAESSRSGRLRARIAPQGEAARRAALAILQGESLGIDTAVAQPAPLFESIQRFSEGGAKDVVLVMPGVEVPYAWDSRLAKAAHAEREIAAAVPLCDASPLHALVAEAHRERARGRCRDVDRSAYAMGTRSYYEVPSLHPFCAYLRGDALRRVAGADAGSLDAATLLEELSQAWRSRGLATVLCDFIYVGAAEATPATSGASTSVERSAFELHHPLGALRRAVNEALERGLGPVSTPALDDKPVLLHVMHFWGGGVDKWVRDFARADSAHANLLLATYRIGKEGGQRIVLYADADAKTPLHTWDIARPLLSTEVASLEYREILRQIVAEFDIEAIVVSSLIGHSLDALSQPLPTLVVAHDYYPVCPNINPRFDETCGGCKVDDMARCLEASEFREVFGDKPPAQWQALRDAYIGRLLEGRVRMVVPTESVAATLRRLDSRLAAVPIRVIPHGIDFTASKLPVPSADPARPLRIVVVGRLNAYKGSSLLRSAAPALASLAEIHLLGCGADGMKLAEEFGWSAVERYELADLPRLLAAIAPHAALLPTVVPETFSYTLSELWTLGIPPIATALGAFRERIRDGIDGFLFEPKPEELVRLLAGLKAQPERLAAVARAVSASGPVRTTREMVADYAPMLPEGTRDVARFRIGIGRETALTEPYRQLNEAYAQLSAAYRELSAAYGLVNDSYQHTRTEFERVHACYERAQAQLDHFRDLCQELGAMHFGVRLWLAPRAALLVDEMRRKMADSAASAAPQKTRS